MNSIRVAVSGGTGRTGSAVLRHLATADDVELVGVLARTHAGKSISVVLPDVSVDVPIYSNISYLLDSTRPQVVVDFSSPDAARKIVPACIKRRIHPVIGTTGLSATDESEFAKACEENCLGGALIANFSLGAAALLAAAKLVSGFFSDACLIETYPHTKKDIPSGTSVRLLAALAKQPSLEETGIPVHSIRINGVISQQEVRYGGEGESISLTHQVVDRACFGPGVLRTVRRIQGVNHLVTELADLL